jgi:2-C-methyl-D-erythritol 4-phosphate cytidylyltransferase
MYVCLTEFKFTEFLVNNKYLVRTSQETVHNSVRKVKQLMRLRGTVTVYHESHTEHTNALYEQNAEFQYVKAGATTVTTIFKGLRALYKQTTVKLNVHWTFTGTSQ